MMDNSLLHDDEAQLLQRCCCSPVNSNGSSYNRRSSNSNTEAMNFLPPQFQPNIYDEDVEKEDASVSFFHSWLLKHARQSSSNNISSMDSDRCTNSSSSSPMKGVLVVVGGFLVHLCLGTVYTWGTLAVYVISYMRELQLQHLLQQSGVDAAAAVAAKEEAAILFENQHHIVRLSDAAWVLACEFAGMAIAMPIGGKIQQKIGPMKTVLLGGGLMSLSVYLSSFSLFNYFYFFILFGFLQGCGLGIAYTGPLLCGLSWFPHRKGLISGVITAGFGTGALLFSPIQASFLNPNNVPPSHAPFQDFPAELYYTASSPEEQELLLRVPLLLQRLASVYFLLLLLGALLLQQPPQPQLTTHSTKSPIEKTTSKDWKHQRADQSQQWKQPQQPYNLQQPELSTVQQQQPQQQQRRFPYSMQHQKSYDMTLQQQAYGICTGQNLSHDVSAGADFGANQKQQVEQTEAEKSGAKKLPPSEAFLGAAKRGKLRVWKALFSASFCSLWLLFFLNGLSICFTASFWRFLAVDSRTKSYMLTEAQLALVGAAASACNAAGRLFWGLLADKVNFQTSLVLLSSLWGVFLFLLPKAATYGEICYAVSVCISFFCLGGNFSVFPAAIVSLYGREALGTLYGYLFASQLVSSLCFAFLTQHFIQSLGSDGLCQLMSCFCFCSAAAIFCLPIVAEGSILSTIFYKQRKRHLKNF